ncbi:MULTISPECIES: NRAMP family divalent metal transporter [Burkholderia cepacia complex]|uniref:NRAMP family divalent metal transporter n=1 Tax=Burkholderia cepacia complex TaxID=87882 RepID=UPI000D009F55|nr:MULTISPECIES: divalent metal cation transporter [Burkholderia cepacia complex]MBK1820784.1 divalent metal cation transporter [Burkholderia orbicola]MBR8308518.1 divalent metal cation transporter [Burkholderia cenocepacia]MCF1371375.1 divalent metal cation transporter [Burkholderia cenocepacia]MCF1388854.1 divalent metal cation transporter [Burkholderia cenocepacia]MDR8080664.1 divalent metal cation transporter [Burkholderia cenocepacia]
MSGLDEDAQPAAEAPPAAAKPWYRRLGPGLLAGASDADPSNVAVYAQAGSQFGFNMLWMIVVTLPMMVAVQLASAFIGRRNREGLVAGIRQHYSERVAKMLIGMVVIVNVVNVGADLAAMGDATALVVGGRSYWYAPLYGIASLALQVMLSYERYARWLKWMTLGLIAYVLELGFVHVDWGNLLHAIVLPHIAFTHDYATTAVAVLGTTLSPYLFVWQAALEVEETTAEQQNGERNTRSETEQRITFDTWTGMIVTNAVSFCIMVIGAAVFFAHGRHDIGSTAQAAEALRPIAGEAAFLVFAFGIVGCGLLAIPAFAGSAAYGCAEAWRFREGLNEPVRRAPAFYTVLALCVIVGIAICFSPIDPIRALYWSAVLNGVAAVPMLVLVMLLSQQRDAAGQPGSGPVSKMFGWLAVALMAVSVVTMIVDVLT